MLLAWLALVLCMGYIVAANTGTERSGSLFAFLLSTPHDPAPLPPVMTRGAATPPPPAATQELPGAGVAPVVEPPAAEPPKQQAEEWLAVPKGKKAGSGVLHSPEVTVLDSGDVEVRFAVSGEPGDFQAFYPESIHALAIDLMGSWGRGARADKRLRQGVLQRVQIADHKKWLRVSGIARAAGYKLGARVEYAPSLKALRVVFSKKQ